MNRLWIRQTYLSAAENQAISQKVLQLHKHAKAQVGIVIVPTTGQEDIFAYAMRVADKWKLGISQTRQWAVNGDCCE